MLNCSVVVPPASLLACMTVWHVKKTQLDSFEGFCCSFSCHCDNILCLHASCWHASVYTYQQVPSIDAPWSSALTLSSISKRSMLCHCCHNSKIRWWAWRRHLPGQQS